MPNSLPFATRRFNRNGGCKRGLAGTMYTGVPHTAAGDGRLDAEPDRIIHELPELLDVPVRGCALR